MLALSAMKCTPQNTMYSASGRAAASRADLAAVAADVGELDDLVALVAAPQHQDPVTPERPSPRGRVPPGQHVNEPVVVDNNYR